MAETAALSIETEDSVLRVAPSGDWTVRSIQSVVRDLKRASDKSASRYVIDVSELGRLDTAGALTLGRVGDKLGAEIEVEGEHPYAERLIGETLEHAGGECETRSAGPGVVQVLDRFGRSLHGGLQEAYDTLAFFGRTLSTFAMLARHPDRIRWTSTVHVMESAGVNALPIIATLAFFIGAVVAFMGATQLATFGASVFTVELVTIGVLREFGVLITAIMLAGRSDSAFTAQIGAMRMQQEIDAMKVLGLDPYVVLVAPRVIAIVIMAPLLTFVAMMTGIFGGMLVIWFDLGMTPGYFVGRMYDTTAIQHFWAGMAKAPVFAVVIAVIGCRQGMNVGGNVESLGKRTTASVVQSIFAVIVIDAIFAMTYLEMGI